MPPYDSFFFDKMDKSQRLKHIYSVNFTIINFVMSDGNLNVYTLLVTPNRRHCLRNRS